MSEPGDIKLGRAAVGSWITNDISRYEVMRYEGGMYHVRWDGTPVGDDSTYALFPADYYKYRRMEIKRMETA